jgi:hypothetical protein
VGNYPLPNSLFIPLLILRGGSRSILSNSISREGGEWVQIQMPAEIREKSQFVRAPSAFCSIFKGPLEICSPTNKKYTLSLKTQGTSLIFEKHQADHAISFITYCLYSPTASHYYL